MIKREVHTKTTPSSQWEVTIPENGSKARPLAAYTPAGNSLQWDEWQFENGVLIVNFGIDQHFGDLVYEYDDGVVEVDTPPATDGNIDDVSYASDGNVVNITINQGTTGTPSQGTFN